MKKYLAEMIGTMVLVLMGCGTAGNFFGIWFGSGSDGLHYRWHLWLPYQPSYHIGRMALKAYER